MKRSSEQMNTQHELAKRLLDMGLKKADVAYRDVDNADVQREAEDPKLEVEAVPAISFEDRDALMRMTRQLLIDAFQAGNVQDYARLIREYERLARMGGLSHEQ